VAKASPCHFDPDHCTGEKSIRRCAFGSTEDHKEGAEVHRGLVMKNEELRVKNGSFT